MSVEIEGLKQLEKQLKTLNNFTQWAQKPMRQSVDLLYDTTQEQPKKAAGAFSALATAGQRRAYWAKVRSGEAKHSSSSGYVRSGDLKRGWKKRIRKITNGLSGVVENTVAHGMFVQGRFRQRFHKRSGWQTTQEIEQKHMSTIQKFWNVAIEKVLKS